MKRQILWAPIIILLFGCMVGCKRASSTPSSLPSPQPSPTATYLASATPEPSETPSSQPPVTSTPTLIEPTATTTPDISLPPANILQYRPFEILPALPSNSKPTDRLLLAGHQSYLLSFETQIRQEPLPDGGCFSTSPDGKWLAYCTTSDDSPTGEWLIVESNDRQQQIKAPMDKHLLYFDSHLWLDNQRLIFPSFREETGPHPMVVINPFTQEQAELASDYPNLWLSGSLSFGYSDVVYGPSLEMVVYPEEISGHSFIVLWNRQEQIATAKIEFLTPPINYPIWSPAETQLALAGMTNYDKKTGNTIHEWYGVTRYGDVTQWTHFGDYFESARIGSAGWSPDGEKLAFWLNVTPSLCPGQQLAILEAKTQRVTNFCVSGTLGYDALTPPVWSPDNRFIAIQKRDGNSLQIILVNIEQSWATSVTDKYTDEYVWPAGWLKSP